MLHPTELPDCADLLEQVLDFQERLLEFGCRMPAITPDDFRAELGNEVFDWLDSTNARRKLFQPIYAFAELPQDEKESILADFRHDRTFWDNADDATFQFRLLGDDENRKMIRMWLIRYFDIFSTTMGLDAALLGRNQSIGKGNWLQDYQEKNNRRITCAVCDGSMNHGVTVEHFLPKSRYPALSVHPYNLLPTCNKCNNGKGEKYPLDGHNLTTVFVPYKDDVCSVAHLEFSDDGHGGEIVGLAPNTPDPVIESQLQSFSALFDIPGQWQRNIHEISEIAWRGLRDYVTAIRDEGVTLERATMPDRLDRLCRRMESDWGTAHYYYPATEWLRWARDEKLGQICQEFGIA